MPGIQEANLAFATKQLRVRTADPAAALKEIQRTADAIEPGVVFNQRTDRRAAAAGRGNVIYHVEGLDCANCAAKIERAINEIPGVDEATIVFPTKQLMLTAADQDAAIAEIRTVTDKIETGVTYSRRDNRPVAKAETKKKKGFWQENAELIPILVGAAVFGAAIAVEKLVSEAWAIPLFIAAYLILGGKIVMTAAKNLTKGQVFDENFLMSIATLGAFAIGEFPEAVAVMLFFRVGEWFEDKAVERSRSQIMEAVDMRPETVNRVTGTGSEEIPAEDAAVGDVLLIRPGDRIPLDGVIVAGESRIDTSPVTGEPVPVAAGVGDAVISGTVNTSGLLEMKVEKVLAESMVTRILDSVENAAASKPKLDRFITRFARIYTPIVVGVAVLTAIVPSLITGDWSYWVYTALTFLVISCPCALVLSVPLAFFSGIGAGSKKGILFKGGVALEAMHNIAAVVMDKTGTITKGSFEVEKVVAAADLGEDELLALAAAAESKSTHPIAVSIVTAAKAKGLTINEPAAVEEIAGKGLRVEVNNRSVLIGNPGLLTGSGVDIAAYTDQNYGTQVLLAVDGRFAGYIVIADQIKADAAGAIARLKKLGLKTVMLTGDAKSNADAVGKELGIDEVYAQLLPDEKLTRLQGLRTGDKGVMFVGDGINDAPVLAGADVGAAMGSGADAAIEAADVVFMNSQTEAIPEAVEIGKSAYRIAVQNVAFALVVKVIVMALGLMGFASMWLAVFADTGVSLICILNSIRVLYKK